MEQDSICSTPTPFSSPISTPDTIPISDVIRRSTASDDVTSGTVGGDIRSSPPHANDCTGRDISVGTPTTAPAFGCYNGGHTSTIGAGRNEAYLPLVRASQLLKTNHVSPRDPPPCLPTQNYHPLRSINDISPRSRVVLTGRTPLPYDASVRILPRQGQFPVRPSSVPFHEKDSFSCPHPSTKRSS